jgi:hypothetical protein
MALTAGATAGALLFSTLYLQRTLGYPPLAVGAGFAPPEADHGLASGLVNTAQEVGSAMGLAVLASIAAASGGAVLVGYCWGTWRPRGWSPRRHSSPPDCPASLAGSRPRASRSPHRGGDQESASKPEDGRVLMSGVTVT